MPHESRKLRRLAILWLLFVAASLAALVSLQPQNKIESNVLALLPDGDTPQIPQHELHAITTRISNQLVFLVSAPAGNSTTAPAEYFFNKLQQLPELQSLGGPVDADQQSAYAKFYYDHRAQLIGTSTRESIAGNSTAAAQNILAQIYSPFAGVSSAELKNDPLLLTRSLQTSALKSAGSIQFKNNWPTAVDSNGREWRLINAELRNTSFHINSTRALCEKLDALTAGLSQKFPGSEVLQHGALFYSHYAANSAARDIALIGTSSLLGIIALLLLFFRSAKPILLTLLSMSVGFSTGALALFLIFGNAHIITLALGTSVVGLSLDYAIHYLTERVFNISVESPLASLKKLLPTLLMALATTVAAYLILLLAPFPALRQLATFAAFGLTSAFITVVLWFPFLSKKFKQRPPPAVGITTAWLRIWRTNKLLRIGLPTILAIAGISSAFLVKIDDDIARLQGFPEEFRQREQRITTLIGQNNSPTFFLVRSPSAQQTLELLEQLTPLLEQAAADKKLRDFRSLSTQLPSLNRQQKNFDTVASSAPEILRQLRDAEIPVPSTSPYTFTPLTPETWLASPLSRGLRLLWFNFPQGGARSPNAPSEASPTPTPPVPPTHIGTPNQRVSATPTRGPAAEESYSLVASRYSLADGDAAPASAIIPVSAADDSAMLAIAQKIPGVHWINQRAEISRVFAIHRHQLTLFLAAAAALIAVFFSIRFGLRRGLRNTLPILLAIGTSTTVLVLAGLPLNLFAMLALILVLGVGIDYTLFLTNPRGHPVSITLSVLVAALTTQLTFGMLALSRTPVIATFGIILASGIVTAFLLAPLAQPDSSDRQ